MVGDAMTGERQGYLDTRWFFIAVLLAAAVLHMVLAASTQVSGDEAYYWDCSRHLDWSYFDQPPLVIWAITPFRALLGESRLAVRAPAVLASLLIGAFMVPVARRLGGGIRQATMAYLVLHGTPLFFLGSFYCSTDIAMGAAYMAATWAAVALAQGERRAWWGFGIAVGVGFLAKFPVVVVLPALLPAMLRGGAARDLRTPTPYLAGLTSLALTTPVWLWGARHDWANFTFQMAGRHQGRPPTAKYLLEFLAGNLLLVTPFLFLALIAAWWVSRKHRDPAWAVVRMASVSPLVFFGLVGLRTKVAPHWAAPGLMVAFLLLASTRFRGRRVLQQLGVAFGVTVSLAAIAVVAAPERLLDLEWRYRGRPVRISPDALSDLIGNREISDRVAAARRPDEIVSSQSYSEVHLFAFLSEGATPTRLAHITGGRHGLASLYWYPREDLQGRDMLFVTDREDAGEKLPGLFEDVEEIAPIEIVRSGRVVRTMRMFRCRNLLNPVPAFTRLD